MNTIESVEFHCLFAVHKPRILAFIRRGVAKMFQLHFVEHICIPLTTTLFTLELTHQKITGVLSNPGYRNFHFFIFNLCRQACGPSPGSIPPPARSHLPLSSRTTRNLSRVSFSTRALMLMRYQPSGIWFMVYLRNRNWAIAPNSPSEYHPTGFYR